MPAPVLPVSNSATAFVASGNTQAIGDASGGNNLSLVDANGKVPPCLQIYNGTDATAFVYLSPLATGASVTVATPGTPGNGVPIPAGACLVLGVPPGTSATGLCIHTGGTTGAVYLTPGAGL